MELIQIRELTTYNAQMVQTVDRLLDQLVLPHETFTEEALRNLVSSPACHLFFLYVGDVVAGMMTLGSYSSPVGTKYWVEDVVVDCKYRGRSYGRRLVDYAIDYIRKQGKAMLMLTSRPSRVEANRLYQSVGFQPKQTNVYIMEFSGDGLEDKKE